MIDKFSVLYVGQIELDNIGLGGTPADERRYPNERLTEGLANSERLAVLLDELASTLCGQPNTTFNGKATSACPT